MKDHRNNPRFSSININKAPTLDQWSWQEKGACKNLDTEIFFLDFNEKGKSKRNKNRTAIEICKKCPVKMQCLEHAITTPENFGVWGGATPEQRAIIRRTRNIVSSIKTINN